jgi:hypothetical protein
LRILRLIFRLELIAAIEVDEDVLPLQPFEVERDADAERRLRAPKGIKLQPILASLVCLLSLARMRGDVEEWALSLCRANADLQQLPRVAAEDRWHVGCAERERFVPAPRPLND